MRNALSLITTTGLTSALGLVFWLLAARRYSTDVVGRSSAEIAGATLVATIATLNIGAVLTRLLPAAGIRSRGLVVRSYGVTCGLAFVLAIVTAYSRLGRSFIEDTPLAHAAFVVMCVLLLVFALQDAVLTGLRRAPAILLENGTFAAVKLGALVALAVVLPETGIVVAWVAPVLIAVLAVNIYLFASVLPAHHADAQGRAELPPRRRLVSFVSAEYTKGMLAAATTWLLPLIVTARLGHTKEAYFYLPWVINYAAAQLPQGISAAFVVESAYAGRLSARALRRSVAFGAAIVGSCVLVEFFVVPFVLRFAGPGYAEHGTTLMRILAVALPFNAINGVYGTFAWMEQKLWRLVALQGAMTTILLGGTLLFIDHGGIDAVGLCYLAGHFVLGVGSLAPIRRRFRAAREEPVPGAVPSVVTDPDGVTVELSQGDEPGANL